MTSPCSLKRVFTLFILYLLVSFHGFSQNLVPNGGFENHIGCPSGNWQINYAKPWFSASSTISPDYYDTCNHGNLGVPKNLFGSQLAQDNGAGYAGIYVFGNNGFREYLEVKLDSTLVLGQTYCLQFWVALPDTFVDGIGSIGAYFSKDSALENNDNPLGSMVTPQIVHDPTTIITDKTNWTLINGSYTASGGENFLTIGNFASDRNTLWGRTVGESPVGDTLFYTGFSYYYVDNVSLMRCVSGTGLSEIPSAGGFNAYPSPAHGSLTVHMNYGNDGSDHQISLFNLLGTQVLNLSTNESNITFPIGHLSPGIYFIRVSSAHSNPFDLKKIIVN